MNGRVHRLLSGLAAAILAAGVVGCGGDDDESSTGTSAASEGSSPAADASSATGPTIKIGVVSTLSGPYASSLAQASTVAPAWQDWINANGGIAGHPVEVVVGDDENNPSVGQSIVQDMVSQDVVAIVQPGDNTLSSYDSALIEQGIPLIGGTSVQQDWYTKPGMFPTATSVGSQVSNAYTAIADEFVQGEKMAWVYCAEIAACEETVAPLSAAAEKVGLGFTSLSASATAPSYTAQCLQMQQEAVDVVGLGANAATNEKLVQDCNAQGYNPTYLTSDLAYSPSFLELDATMYGVGVQFPTAYAEEPVAAFTAAMEEYASDDNWQGGNATHTWAGLQVAAKAIESANVSATAAVTPANVLDGLYNFKDENVEGLLANKLTFTRGEPTGPDVNPCWFVFAIEDGELTAPADLTPQCPAS